MNTRTPLAPATLVLTLALTSQTLSAGTNGDVVRVRTAEQIVAAIEKAHFTGRAVIIKVAPGHYRFSRSFDTPFGPSRLPPIASILNGGSIDISNSTIGGNSAGTLGGAISNGGTVNLESVTLVRNEVRGELTYNPDRPPGCDFADTPEVCGSGGGGIWSTTLSSVRIKSSVIALNTTPGRAPDCNSALSSAGYNLLGSTRGCSLVSDQTTDQTDIDPRLGHFEDDGEPGNAHYSPLTNSPLIDAAGLFPGQCTVRDQIRRRRADGDGDGQVECDIGAIEKQRPRKHY